MKVEATPPTLNLPTPGGSGWDPLCMVVPCERRLQGLHLTASSLYPFAMSSRRRRSSYSEVKSDGAQGHHGNNLEARHF